jgi:hypothetical protein
MFCLFHPSFLMLKDVAKHTNYEVHYVFFPSFCYMFPEGPNILLSTLIIFG